MLQVDEELAIIERVVRKVEQANEESVYNGIETKNIYYILLYMLFNIYTYYYIVMILTTT